MAEEIKPRLGRGLAALLGDQSDESTAIDNAKGQKRVPIEFLKPNVNNPRKNFDPEDLNNLANSIKQRGVLQPVLVRTIPRHVDEYEIIAGERRWRAAQIAGLQKIPIIIVEAGDREALEIAIVENVQRSDLNAMEEARGYEYLISEYNYSQLELANIIGKSRSHVANTLRLLKLPSEIHNLILSGGISAGHARALLSVEDADNIAKKIMVEGLTVRDVEKLAKNGSEKLVPRNGKANDIKEKADGLHLKSIVEDMKNTLGLNVSIKGSQEKGSITINYKNLDQLNSLHSKIMQLKD